VLTVKQEPNLYFIPANATTVRYNNTHNYKASLLHVSDFSAIIRVFSTKKNWLILSQLCHNYDIISELYRRLAA
jgi:hypothetical protein